MDSQKSKSVMTALKIKPSILADLTTAFVEKMINGTCAAIPELSQNLTAELRNKVASKNKRNLERTISHMQKRFSLLVNPEYLRLLKSSFNYAYKDWAASNDIAVKKVIAYYKVNGYSEEQAFGYLLCINKIMMSGEIFHG